MLHVESKRKAREPMRCKDDWGFPHVTRSAQVRYSHCMCADIYRTKDSNTFLLVPRGANLGAVPEAILNGLGHPVFLTTRDLNEPLLRSDTAAINSELASQGFSVREG